jgi:hypothetical protein
MFRQRERWTVTAFLLGTLSLLSASPALADPEPRPGAAPAPPPTNIPYWQYGVSLVSEGVIDAGSLCADKRQPCIFGSGAGVAVRLGVRTAGPWYFGGAYELSKQDPNNLYRLAILQQLRAEARYYLDTGRDVQPVAHAGGGIAGYGNEWKVDTGGPMAFLGVGLEVQISRRLVFGAAISYRAIYFNGFTDSSRASRDGGFASLIGLDLVLENRDPL